MSSEDSSAAHDTIYDRNFIRRPMPTWHVDTWYRSRRKTQDACDLTRGFASYTMFTLCDRHGGRCGYWLQLSWQQFCPVSHELNMISFVRSSVWQSHQLYKLKPITSISEMTWHDTWNAKETLKLIEIVQKTTLFFGKWTTKKKNERKVHGTLDAAMHLLHICYTMRANCSFAICGNVEFSAAECGKAIRGNLRNIPHLIFCKLPIDNFLHSAISILQNTRALLPSLLPSVS